MFKVPERVGADSRPCEHCSEVPGDQDPNTPGDQAVAEREVAENMETTVGDPVKAVDGDLLMYSVDPDGQLQRGQRRPDQHGGGAGLRVPA